MNIDIETKSTMYLLPLIAQDAFTCSSIINEKSSFVNAYNRDINTPSLDKNIFLLFNFKLDSFYVKMHKKLESLEGYLNNSTYIVDDKSYLLYRYEIPSRFIDDYELIVNGNYSRLSDACKNTIVKFWENNRDFLHSVFQINTNSELLDEIGENTYSPTSIFESEFVNDL